MASQNRRVIVTPNDGFFDDLVVYFFAFQSFVHTVAVYNAGVEKGWPDDDVASFDAKQANARLNWAPAPLLRTVCANRKPSTIEFDEAHNDLSGAGALNLGAIDPLLFSFGQSLITNYYERYLAEIEGKWGNDRTRWPGVWNFGRVLRNAMSHGGRIDFRNKNASSVKWRGLIYSPADEGRLVLHTDLWPGDLYYLLREMDEARKNLT